MLEKQPVHDLFPISYGAAYCAFSVLDTRVKSYRDINECELYIPDINRLTDGTNSHLFRFLIRNERLFQELGRQVDEQGMADASKLLGQDPPSPSYLLGMYIGHDALLEEATGRNGILPIVPKDLVYTWSKDHTKHIIRDLNTLADFMEMGEDIEDKLSNLARVERMNRFGSGYVQTILRGEPALLEAINSFLPEDVNMYSACKIKVRPLTRGLADVVSIFKAHHEAEMLLSTFRLDP